MRLSTTAALAGLAIATAACGQGGSDNVMSPEANALEPADVNAALGPEPTDNMPALESNDMNSVAAPDDNGMSGDEPGSGNSAG